MNERIDQNYWLEHPVSYEVFNLLVMESGQPMTKICDHNSRSSNQQKLGSSHLCKAFRAA
jgi:hypothetical protein